MQKQPPQERAGALPATADDQIKVLEGRDCGILPFSRMLAKSGNAPLYPAAIDILQINIGYLCNLLCRHCHVNAGPERKEVMTEQTMQSCIDALSSNAITTVDITGGAPEMNPRFRWFVKAIRTKRPDIKIIVRSNLTLLTGNPEYSDLPELFKKLGVTIIASLPCHTRGGVDTMRGKGVFDRSIAALKLLNELGYGKEGGPELNLVYNPTGPSLPEEQQHLEADYRKRLIEEHAILFSHLYTITNMPISRFLNDLLESGQYCNYMELLEKSYNPLSVTNLMCKKTISVGWDGRLYDCDFNQMLGLQVAASTPRHISEFNPEMLLKRPVILGQHCYGCTAGAGSSCQGSLV